MLIVNTDSITILIVFSVNVGIFSCKSNDAANAGRIASYRTVDDAYAFKFTACIDSRICILICVSVRGSFPTDDTGIGIFTQKAGTIAYDMIVTHDQVFDIAAFKNLKKALEITLEIG